MIAFFIFMFVFLLIAVGLLITLELYAKHCAVNNGEVIRHGDWLMRAGMKETYHIVSRRWKSRI